MEKPLTAFRLEPDLPPRMEGLDRLHRQACLIYRYRDGREERLRLGADLFHLLLELSDGYQLGDVSTDDTFAHLSIFVQRLVREDDRTLLSWNPMREKTIYKITGHQRRGRRTATDGHPAITKGGPIMADSPRLLVEEVLARDMTREIWSGNYDKALPVSVQDFELSAVLPAVFYMFRFGHRRGVGKFLKTYGSNSGTLSQRRRSATIERIAEKLAGTDDLHGFGGEAEKAILGDLLLCFCLENVRRRLGPGPAGSARFSGSLHGELDRSSPKRCEPSLCPRDDRRHAGQSARRIRRVQRRQKKRLGLPWAGATRTTCFCACSTMAWFGTGTYLLIGHWTGSMRQTIPSAWINC